MITVDFMRGTEVIATREMRAVPKINGVVRLGARRESYRVDARRSAHSDTRGSIALVWVRKVSAETTAGT